MINISAFEDFQIGLKRFPFHIVTLTILLVLGVNGYVPAGQTRVLMSILAGVMLSPFYNAFASLMYNVTDKFLITLIKKIPSWFKPILQIILGYVLIGADAVTISRYGLSDLTSIYLLILTIMIWISIAFDLLTGNDGYVEVSQQVQLDEYC